MKMLNREQKGVVRAGGKEVQLYKCVYAEECEKKCVGILAGDTECFACEHYRKYLSEERVVENICQDLNIVHQAILEDIQRGSSVSNDLTTQYYDIYKDLKKIVHHLEKYDSSIIEKVNEVLDHTALK